MTLGHRGKLTNSEREVSSARIGSEMANSWGEMTGKIVSFDPFSQTATIQPDYEPVHNGKQVKMPELLEVPVRFQRVGGFIVTAPVKAGDKVVLRPKMRSSEGFHGGGSDTSNGDFRVNSLSDMEAFLDGGEPLSNPISSFNAENFEIRSEDGSFKIEMSQDGKFKIQGPEGNLIDLLTEVTEKLGTESLQHSGSYSSIGAKLRSMTL